MTIHRGTCVATALLLAGCSAIFGADFDARPRAEADGGEGYEDGESEASATDATEPTRTETGGTRDHDARGGRSAPGPGSSPAGEDGGASSPSEPGPLPACSFTRTGTGLVAGTADTTKRPGRLTLAQNAFSGGVELWTPAPAGLDATVTLLAFDTTDGSSISTSLVVRCVGQTGTRGVTLEHAPKSSTTSRYFSVEGSAYGNSVGGTTPPVPAILRARAVNGGVRLSFTAPNGVIVTREVSDCVPDLVGVDVVATLGFGEAVFDDFTVAGHCESTFDEAETF